MRWLVPALLLLAGLGWFLGSRGPSDAEVAPSAMEPGVPGAESPEPESNPLVQPGASRDASGDRSPGASTAPQQASRESAPEAASPAEPAFVVRAFDAQGSPAEGLPVVLQRPKLFQGFQALKTATTDETGRARFPFDPNSKQANDPYGQGLVAHVDIPHEEPIRLSLPHAPQPGDEFTITLPALGAVVVEVLGPDGEPFTEQPVKVWSRWIPAGKVGIEVYGGYERCHDAYRRTADGVTAYDPVGLGIVMTTTVQARGFLGNSLSDYPGPKAPGETIHVSIPLGKAVPFVQAQLLDMEGKPMADYKLKASVFHVAQEGAKPRSVVYVREVTDREGRFSFPFTTSLQAEGERYLQVEHYQHHAKLHVDPTWSQARASIPHTWSGEEDLDLGSLRLQPPHVLVSGRVTDVSGRALRKVRIDVGAFQPGSSGWPWRHSTRIYTDDQGGYQLRDFDVPEKLRLQVVHAEYVAPEQVVIPRGQAGIDFVLQPRPTTKRPPTGDLRVAVLCDEGVHPAYFEMELCYADGHTEQLPLLYLTPEVRTLQELRAGPLTIKIRHRLEAEPVLTVEDLEIPVGGLLNDARLDPIDLRGQARMARWSLQTPDGRPLRDEEIKLRLPGSTEKVEVSTDQEGVLQVPLPRLATRVELSLVRGQWQAVQVGQRDPVRFSKP